MFLTLLIDHQIKSLPHFFAGSDGLFHELHGKPRVNKLGLGSPQTLDNRDELWNTELLPLQISSVFLALKNKPSDLKLTKGCLNRPEINSNSSNCIQEEQWGELHELIKKEGSHYQ